MCLTPDYISAIANISIAIATWVLVIQALRSIHAWKGSVHASEELERKKAARKLHQSANKVAKEIAAIRAGKVTPTELDAGINVLGQDGKYMPQPKTYYLATIDRLHHLMWETWADSIVFLPSHLLGDLKRFGDTVVYFRDSYARLHFGSAVIVAALTSSDKAELTVEMLRVTARVPENGPDIFHERLMKDLERVVLKLSPFIDGSGAP